MSITRQVSVHCTCSLKIYMIIKFYCILYMQQLVYVMEVFDSRPAIKY